MRVEHGHVDAMRELLNYESPAQQQQQQSLNDKRIQNSKTEKICAAFAYANKETEKREQQLTNKSVR